jgi:hypothetical protein
VRAFPVGVDLPNGFTIAAEQHEAQRNIEILSTTERKGSKEDAGAGTPKDPRKRDKRSEMWWEELTTIAPQKEGKRFVVWAFDPSPSKELTAIVRDGLGKHFGGFSRQPPDRTGIGGSGSSGSEVDPGELTSNRKFARASGVGKGLFAHDRLLRAASLTLEPKKLAKVQLRFDHSNIGGDEAIVFHAAQWDASGRPEGGMTIVAIPPT